MNRRGPYGRGWRGKRPRDRGAASLWLLVVGLVIVAAGLAGAAVGAATVARHRARTAADLGALAGAAWVLQGQATACARASEIVAANGARLVACAVQTFDLVVTAEVEVTPMPGLRGSAHVSARAGPVRA